jgi:ParB family chromosome partitioning protein
MAAQNTRKVHLIEIDKVNVKNGRTRETRVFNEIVENIAKVGLKRPITVARRSQAGAVAYDLICGQGRLEAYQQLGQTRIPAIIKVGTEQTIYLMSLIENIARQKLTLRETLSALDELIERGYMRSEIAAKTGLSKTYIREMLKLKERGADRLMEAVDKGTISVSLALQITEMEDKNAQNALNTAVETGQIEKWEVRAVSRLVASHSKAQKAKQAHSTKGAYNPVTPERIVNVFRKEMRSQGRIIEQAEFTKDHLEKVVRALRTALTDPGFADLLAEEKLLLMPAYLATEVAT